jgi:5-(carboxyamino)imidazole ribonucleotide synthase
MCRIATGDCSLAVAARCERLYADLMPDVIDTTHTLGMLGGGQLGRMFVQAAQRLGYRTHVFCPEPDCPASQIAEQFTQASYNDLAAVEAFAKSVAVVTYEFENVPAATAAACAKHVPVRPGQHVLRVAQDRIREKTFLHEQGIPVAPFFPVLNEHDLDEATATLGLPGVLKTSGGGYDGKGQRVIHSENDRVYAWGDLGRVECVYERFIDFEQEVSVVAARSVAGEIVTYGPIANTHRNQILDVSILPSGASPEVEHRAREIARQVMESLEVVGVLCVEFFQVRSAPESCVYDQLGPIIVNELAPRPHNSGHLTIEAFTCSQFEQQVRTVCGLPLGEVKLRRPAAMANLLGDLWAHGEPAWSRLNTMKDVTLHLYGKRSARPGRKMGHLTALARTAHEALRDAVEARAMLRPSERISPD